MAVIVTTNSATELLAKIREAINVSRIETWRFDSDGDLTHSPSQWADRAWFRAKVIPNALAFGLIGVKQIAMSKEVYGVYHGRLIEMLLAHFDTQFSNVFASAVADKAYDNFV